MQNAKKSAPRISRKRRFFLLQHVVGKKFNRLLVLRVLPSNGDGLLSECMCDCGTIKITPIRKVVCGDTISCGCAARESAARINKSHGLSKTREYSIWCNMIQRCTNKNREYYPYYGGRNISVCHRWEKFENFLLDMGKCPKGKTLDRIDSNKDYSVKNCRWATRQQQANNRRSNKWVTYDSKTLTVAQWARELKLNENTLYGRLRRGIAPPKLFER